NRFARRRVQQRRRVQAARLLAQLVDLRLRTRGLEALADGPLELRHLRLRQAIGADHLERLAVFGQRGVQLILRLELLRLLDVEPGGLLLRPAQLDLVVRVVGIGLHRLREVDDGGIRVRGAHGFFAPAERARRGTTTDHERHKKQSCEFACHKLCLQSSIASRRSDRHWPPPLIGIVCRPRPSRYSMTTDSTPIFTTRYWPRTVLPSAAYCGMPLPSEKIATRVV